MRALPTLFVAISCLVAPPATAQVVISEIYFTPQISSDDEWIELRNLGTTTVDISLWSLYLATDTPVYPDTYWFGFPPNTRIPAQSSLQVHWMAAYKPKNLAEIWTGNSVFYFLFGYGAEQLGNAANAAVGLFNTQNNASMNNPSIVVDWVTYGDGWTASKRPIREDLAVQNGKWIAGTSVAAPRPGDSIALIYTSQVEPTPVSAFFHDASPTPVISGNPLSGHNHEKAASSIMERAAGVPYTPCTGVGGTAPTVALTSVPTDGNVDFGLHLSDLVPGEVAVLVIGVAPAQLPWPFVPTCSFHIDLTLALLLPYSVTSPTIDQPLSLEGVPSSTIYIQMVTLETKTAVGFDPGHKIVIGK